ncbi:hypothetical protein NSTC745_03878 [Nostoc sp. DSM 114161]|jgi:hypothetical protein|uniref:hypothetical protein n=1 Tax=Nostoc sp. DSM 114161 TaxID=3440143 RepID=UPI004045DE18
MAGLYDTLKITVDTQEYFFRGTKGFYTGAIATATGVSVTTDEAELKMPLIPVKELIKSGILRNAVAIAKVGTKSYRIKLHYTLAKAATVEAAIVGATVPTVAGRVSSGGTFTAFSNPLRVTGRS